MLNSLSVNARIGAKNIKPVLVYVLVDTGGSYRILAVNLVKGFGADISNPFPRETIVRGQGIINLPVVNVPWFNCVGQFIYNFEVAAYNIPATISLDGLLGMDFILSCQGFISIVNGKNSYG